MTMPQIKAAFLSDIHGNTPALEAVLGDVQAQGCGQLFVLGDIINGVDPHGCLDLLHSWAARQRIELVAIRGNGEEYTLTQDLDQFPFAKESFYPSLLLLLKWIQSRLSSADLAWLHSLPEVIIRGDTLMVHDLPVARLAPTVQPGVDPRYKAIMHHYESVMPDIHGDALEQLLSLLETRGLKSSFSGHSHVPFIRRVGPKLICNAGSVGMPLDGDWRPSWVLQAGESLELCRVKYDLQCIFALIDEAEDYPDFTPPGMREAYKQGLAHGLYQMRFFKK